jgi:myo-inositol-1(or 4)-monophosphatase
MDKVSKCFGEIENDVLSYFSDAENRNMLYLTAKEKGEIVTKCDKEIEEIITKRIRMYFLDHGILGEETGLSQNESEYLWHIDPIDNTVGFVSGEDEFSIAISLKRRNEYIQSLIINPIRREIFKATSGKAYKNDSPIETYKGDLENKTRGISTCAYINPANEQRMRSLFSALFAGKYPIRISGGAALDLCRVADGTRAAHVSLGAHFWDVEAGLHMVKNAGGIVEVLTEYPERKSIAFLASANVSVHNSLKSILGDSIKF